VIQPKHWQAIYGDFTFSQDEIVFRGKSSPITTSSSSSNAPSSGLRNHPLVSVDSGLAMCDVRFSGGTLSADIEWEAHDISPTVELLVYWDVFEDRRIGGGIIGSTPDRSLAGHFAISVVDASRANRLLPGSAETLDVVRSAKGAVSLRLVQAGSILDLHADGVHVLRHVISATTPVSQCGLMCQADGIVRVKNYRVETRQRSAFVIMQFGAPYDQFFSDVIRPVVAGCGFHVIRADDTAGPGLILADIVGQIQEAEVVIADITPENQNVFYEVGYAHALGKPTILLAEKGKKLPFDVSGFRTLFYENSIAGKAYVEQGLRRHVEAITRERPAALAV
jgi:hypothetical protein